MSDENNMWSDIIGRSREVISGADEKIEWTLTSLIESFLLSPRNSRSLCN